jgi:hypothetical protein
VPTYGHVFTDGSAAGVYIMENNLPPRGGGGNMKRPREKGRKYRRKRKKGEERGKKMRKVEAKG